MKKMNQKEKKKGAYVYLFGTFLIITVVSLLPGWIGSTSLGFFLRVIGFNSTFPQYWFWSPSPTLTLQACLFWFSCPRNPCPPPPFLKTHRFLTPLPPILGLNFSTTTFFSITACFSTWVSSSDEASTTDSSTGGGNWSGTGEKTRCGEMNRDG